MKLLRARQTVQANEKDLANFTRALFDLLPEWEAEWKNFSDSCQDLEEERLDFMKDILWAYANDISTVCVADDQVRAQSLLPLIVVLIHCLALCSPVSVCEPLWTTWTPLPTWRTSSMTTGQETRFTNHRNSSHSLKGLPLHLGRAGFGKPSSFGCLCAHRWPTVKTLSKMSLPQQTESPKCKYNNSNQSTQPMDPSTDILHLDRLLEAISCPQSQLPPLIPHLPHLPTRTPQHPILGIVNQALCLLFLVVSGPRVHHHQCLNCRSSISNRRSTRVEATRSYSMVRLIGF